MLKRIVGKLKNITRRKPPTVNNEPQILINDILSFIATKDYQVYRSMLLVNKTINKQLGTINPWNEFTEIIEVDLSRQHSGTKTHSYMIIKDSDFAIDNSTLAVIIGEENTLASGYMFHGESVSTHWQHYNGAHRMGEHRYLYKFGHLVKHTQYEQIGLSGYKRLVYSCSYSKGPRGEQYMTVGRYYMGDRDVYVYYRDGKEYHPDEERLVKCTIIVVCIVALLTTVGFVASNYDEVKLRVVAAAKGDLGPIRADFSRLSASISASMKRAQMEVLETRKVNLKAESMKIAQRLQDVEAELNKLND
jgi:hypothetical protein